jgi:hypothetical protein
MVRRRECESARLMQRLPRFASPGVTSHIVMVPCHGRIADSVHLWLKVTYVPFCTVAIANLDEPLLISPERAIDWLGICCVQAGN